MMMIKVKRLTHSVRRLAFIPLLVFFVGLAASAQSVSYHLLKKVPLGVAAGGGEYFDYLMADPESRRVYVSHGTEVKVVDADSGDVVGTITGFKKCHGIVVPDASGKGFVTDGDEGKVFVFDVKTLKITGEIKTAEDSDSIIYDPASKHIFAFNGDSHSASVIDPTSFGKPATVVKTIDMGGGPEFAVADGRGTVFNNIEDKNEVAVIDSRTLTIKARWPVAPAGGPTALAMDREHRRLFSAGRKPQMVVMLDAETGKVLQSMPISGGVDAAVFEDETALLFVSTREGKVHIFHEDSPAKLSEVAILETEFGAKTMALDTKTHNLYLSTADFGEPAANGRRPPKPGTFHLLIYGR
jgi:DNA-binding beta-propeller fold protein YncE